MGKLANVVNSQQITTAPDGRQAVQDLIKKSMPRIMSVAPKHLSEERLYQLTISAINHNPRLMECDAASLLSCVMRCSALGLEPSSVDGLGRAFILPFRNKSKGKMEATFILGYKGMIDLARRSGEIESISARAVYDGDTFEYEFGLNERLTHIPTSTLPKTKENLTHVYMVARFKDGGHYMDVMTKDEIENVRKQSKSPNSPAWVDHYEAMSKKSVVRRGFPYLPVSIEAKEAIAFDDTTGGYVADIVHEPLLVVEPEIIEAEQPSSEPKGLKQAVCVSCGHTCDVAIDSTLDDLNAAGICCEQPSYKFVEE